MSEQTSTTIVTGNGDDASMLAGVTSTSTANAAGRPAPKPARRTTSAVKSAGKSVKPAGKSTSGTKGPRAAVKVSASAPRPMSTAADLLGDDFSGSLTEAKREVACFLVDTLGDALKRYNPKRHRNIPPAFVAFLFASYANYAPVPADYWNDNLAPRSGAGGRGAQNRAPVATKSARTPRATKPAAKPATKPATPRKSLAA
jgi:hypothetical protein